MFVGVNLDLGTNSETYGTTCGEIQVHMLSDPGSVVTLATTYTSGVFKHVTSDFYVTVKWYNLSFDKYLRVELIKIGQIHMPCYKKLDIFCGITNVNHVHLKAFKLIANEINTKINDSSHLKSGIGHVLNW